MGICTSRRGVMTVATSLLCTFSLMGMKGEFFHTAASVFIVLGLISAVEGVIAAVEIYSGTDNLGNVFLRNVVVGINIMTILGMLFVALVKLAVAWYVENATDCLFGHFFRTL